jgi:ribonuclease HI
LAGPGFLIQIDGSALHNPGPAGIGVRIVNPDQTVRKEISHYVGVRTNNQAEYEALLRALIECRSLAPARVTIRTDSELVYYQMSGRYRVRNAELRLLHDEAVRLHSLVPEVALQLVPREENKETDRLAKTAAESGRGRR